MFTLLALSPPTDDRSVMAHALRRFAESARHAGQRLVIVPEILPDVPLDAIIPDNNTEHPYAFFSGRLTESGDYRALVEAGRDLGLQFLNSPDESKAIMEFTRYYPRIRDLTASSCVLYTATDCASVADELGFPLFIKGQIKSHKEHGWNACIANDINELESAVASSEDGAPIVARQILPLRKSGTMRMGFPTAREYRIYLYGNMVLGFAPYWDIADPFGPLTNKETQDLTDLALQAALQIGTPFAAIDVGQLGSGEWTVIEAGDPQYSAIMHMPHALFWQRLEMAVCQ